MRWASGDVTLECIIKYSRILRGRCSHSDRCLDVIGDGIRAWTLMRRMCVAGAASVKKRLHEPTENAPMSLLALGDPRLSPAELASKCMKVSNDDPPEII